MCERGDGESVRVCVCVCCTDQDLRVPCTAEPKVQGGELGPDPDSVMWVCVSHLVSNGLQLKGYRRCSTPWTQNRVLIIN